jgi:hypothetical protein
LGKNLCQIFLDFIGLRDTLAIFDVYEVVHNDVGRRPGVKVLLHVNEKVVKVGADCGR